MIQRVMKAYLKNKRGSQEENTKRGVNVKLQEELFEVSAKDQDKRKVTKNGQKGTKVSDQLNKMDLNNEEDKSKMIEQLMEMSIVTKHTKGK